MFLSQQNTYNADSIVVLEGLEAVRKRPGMYIGSTGSKGVNHLLYEIVDNSVDEHLAGFCTKIKVTLNKDGSATVSDNGRGIPVGMHKQGISAERVVFTTLHAGGKFDNSSYKVSGGLHGVGSSVVNALSSEMTVTIHQNGKIHQDKYSRGVPVVELKKGLLPIIGKTTETGTEISFMPDVEIFNSHTFKPQIIESRLHETAYLNPGLTIEYSCKIKGEEKEIIFYEPDGLIGYVRELNKGHETITNIIQFSGSVDNIEIDCAFQYINSFDETIVGFCNNILNSEGGTHITGFKNRYTTLINTYARDIGTLKAKDDNFTGADTRSGLVAVLSIKHPDPLFEGQTKTKLGSTDATKSVASVVGEQLTLYFDKNIDDLKKIISAAERSAKIRKNEMKNKANMLEKQKFSFDSGSKLSNCESKDSKKCEIFIVEGKLKTCPYPSFLLSQG
jgi:DNA gyrase subunit B